MTGAANASLERVQLNKLTPGSTDLVSLMLVNWADLLQGH